MLPLWWRGPYCPELLSTCPERATDGKRESSIDTEGPIDIMLPSARRETRNEGQVEEFPQAGDDSSVFEHSDAETLCDSKDIILDAREVLSLNACGRQLLHLPMVVYPIIGRKRQIEALLDCGADKTYVSNRLARSMKWTKRRLPPRKVELANGETILSNQGVRIPIRSGTFRDTLTAYKLDIP